MKRKKYFDSQRAFEFIWRSADPDGIWHGDDASLGAEFEVTEDDAHLTCPPKSSPAEM